MSTCDISQDLGSWKISKTSFDKILHEKLCVKKFPIFLPRNRKTYDRCRKTLDRFNGENSKNVYYNISGDESWIYSYELENERQSLVWVFQGKKNPTSHSFSKYIQTDGRDNCLKRRSLCKINELLLPIGIQPFVCRK